MKHAWLILNTSKYIVTLDLCIYIYKYTIVNIQLHIFVTSDSSKDHQIKSLPLLAVVPAAVASPAAAVLQRHGAVLVYVGAVLSLAKTLAEVRRKCKIYTLKNMLRR